MTMPSGKAAEDTEAKETFTEQLCRFTVAKRKILNMTNDELTEKVIGAAIEVHKVLGPGLLESIYEQALCHELELRGINCSTQVEVDVSCKNKVIKGQRIDILVEGRLIIELKAVSKLPDVALAQTLSYLKATQLRLALLVNFGEKRLVDGLKRVSL